MKKFLLVFILLIIGNFVYAKDYFQLGKELFNKKDYVQAQKYFLKELQKNPNNYSCRYYLAHTYVYTYDVYRAKEEYEKIILFAPSSTVKKLAIKSVANLNQSNLTVEEQKIDADNYYDLIRLQGQYVRWREFPINVYVLPSNYSNLIKNAFVEWQKATNGLVQFKFVGNINAAQIVARITDNFSIINQDGFMAGNAVVRVKNNIIYYATINLLNTDPKTREVLSDDIIYTTALHEIGHAIGLQGHSNDNNDLMSAVNSKGVKKITKKDLATLYKLYR